jgi:hypothetical protein
MTIIIRSTLVVFALMVCTSGISLPRPAGPFDEFRDVNCESEMARLDNFAVALQNEPTARAAIIVFAGKMAGDRLPKRGEAEARVERIRLYLTKRRGIPAASIVVMNGGNDNNYHVQLWVVPAAAGLPKPEASSPVMDMQYRPGKVNPRIYACGV